MNRRTISIDVFDFRRPQAVTMENASLPTAAWDNITTLDDKTTNVIKVRDFVVKVIYVILGTLGVFDNLAVLVVFILFIKIADKVSGLCLVKFQLLFFKVKRTSITL